MTLEIPPFRLRPLRVHDHEALAAILTDGEVMAMALDDRAYSEAEARSLLQTHFARGDQVLGMHVIALQAPDVAIGFGGYRGCRLLGADDVEFGWVIAPTYQGRGCATALGRALIEHALRQRKLRRILAACHPANARSEHILRDKLQMQFVREVETRPETRRRVYCVGRDG
jgi:ribosomal-protein-alanine N-acetyltransferase